LITGASAGIGEAFARAYAARGWDLALVARRADRLEALAAELSAAHGIEAYPIAADLSKFEAHVPVLEAIAARGRVVDGLVNNAGFGIAHDFTGVPWETQRDFLMIMVLAACGLAHAVLPGMAERRFGSSMSRPWRPSRRAWRATASIRRPRCCWSNGASRWTPRTATRG
jgi:short-subunit dehydrogenase